MPNNLYEHKINVFGLCRDELTEILSQIGVAQHELKMRVAQLWLWLYVYGVTDFNAITCFKKELRVLFSSRLTLDRPKVNVHQISADGTQKWLIALPNLSEREVSTEVECVFIPDHERGTLCISSQVGCTLNCSFCLTGTQKFVRNLSAQEILFQLAVVKDALKDWCKTNSKTHTIENRRLTNVVFMGMGEPLYNLDHVITAIDILSDQEGIGISRRKITVSTAGVVDQFAKLGECTRTTLAISLHATNNALRDQLVPINRKYPIEMLIEACRTYPNVSNRQRITFEYVMLDHVNDSPEEAHELVKLLKFIPSKINLIPFNPWVGAPYGTSPDERIQTFAQIVNRAGYASPVRKPRGRDISAACGQLKTFSIKLPKHMERHIKA